MEFTWLGVVNTLGMARIIDVPKAQDKLCDGQSSEWLKCGGSMQ